jgi:hypothetical protein
MKFLTTSQQFILSCLGTTPRKGYETHNVQAAYLDKFEYFYEDAFQRDLEILADSGYIAGYSKIPWFQNPFKPKRIETYIEITDNGCPISLHNINTARAQAVVSTTLV